MRAGPQAIAAVSMSMDSGLRRTLSPSNSLTWRAIFVRDFPEIAMILGGDARPFSFLTISAPLIPGSPRSTITQWPEDKSASAMKVSPSK